MYKEFNFLSKNKRTIDVQNDLGIKDSTIFGGSLYSRNKCIIYCNH